MVTLLIVGDSETTRSEALKALSDGQLKKLQTLSRVLAIAPMDPGDLLQGAYLRWLESQKEVETPEDTYRFLVGAMKSIRSNSFRHDHVVERAFGSRIESPADGEDATALLVAPDAATEDSLFAQQVFDLFSDDPEIQEYILLLAGGSRRAEIQAELGWDDRKYEAVQKRRSRAMVKLISEGKV